MSQNNTTRLFPESDDPEPLSADQLLHHMQNLAGFEHQRSQDPAKSAVGISSLESLGKTPSPQKGLRVTDRESAADKEAAAPTADNVTTFPGSPKQGQVKPRPK